jgi:Tol biopolymer transport system component
MSLATSIILAWFSISTASAVEVSVAETGHAYNPTWSPNGDYLAFELNEYEGAVSLYVVKIQNGNPMGMPVRLDVAGSGSGGFGGGSSIAVGPVWHPEGMLLFEGSNAGGTNRLYFWSPGGQKSSELFPTSQIGGDLSWPAVAPDGQKIAFVSDATGNGDIYVWSRSNGQVQQMVTSNASEMAPRYSSDASQIVYSRKNRGGQDLFTLVGTKSSARQGGNGDQTRPIWNGSSVVYFSNERGTDKWDVAVSSGVGQKAVLAKDVRLPHRATPALSSDGKWVAYGVVDPDKSHKVMCTRLDGSKTVGIDTGMVAVGEPSLVDMGGRTYLAFTGIPYDQAEWRQIHIVDVTDKLR